MIVLLPLLGMALAELVALIMALWAFMTRQGTVWDGIAAALAVICLGVLGWGCHFYIWRV
jgi:hypothetical protein